MFESIIWEKTSAQFEVKGLPLNDCNGAKVLGDSNGRTELGSEEGSDDSDNLQEFGGGVIEPGSLGQHESGSIFLSNRFGFTSRQSKLELKPQHLNVDWAWSMRTVYRAFESVQLYLATTPDAAVRNSALNANAKPPIANSNKRMTVTTMPNVSKIQWDSTMAPQQPKKATKNIKNPSMMTLCYIKYSVNIKTKGKKE